ncbi:MAG: ribosome maturation factor RimP [Synergistaceae bacterium]|nr:ribosome maturation factor RimP [Synergistaceae bacterium]
MRGIEEIVNKLGYECVLASLVTESGRKIVRVLIDSLGGIGTSDCEIVSKAVNRWLDERDGPLLSGRYYLEVGSPGLERPLLKPADYGRFRGREARVRTGSLIDGRKTHVGVIKDSDEMRVFLETEHGAVEIPFADVTGASLVFR